MKYICFVLCTCLLSVLAPAARAATLPDTPPYVITILFDLRIARDGIYDSETGQALSEQRGGAYSGQNFTFNSDEMKFFALGSSSLSMEWGSVSSPKSFTYDFDTRRGLLEFGDGISLVDQYSFDGNRGTYWYETDDYPAYQSKRGKLRRVGVYVTAPGAPLPIPHVPLPATVPMLGGGLLALAALRGRRRRRASGGMFRRSAF